MGYLESNDTDLAVEDIKGIWVASDDAEVVARVKEIAPSYLPNVSNDTIFWASGGVEGGPDISRLATRTDHEVRAGRVGSAQAKRGTRTEVEVGVEGGMAQRYRGRDGK